jgi:hypothetical protein
MMLTLAVALIFCATSAMAQDAVPPSVPTGLVATVMSDSEIDLTWTASTATLSVKGYRIRRNGTQVAAMSGPSFASTGLAAGTPYTYTVSAYDTAGNASAWSAPVTATTKAGGTYTPPSGTVLIAIPPCVAPFQPATLGAYLGPPSTTQPPSTLGAVCMYTVP